METSRLICSANQWTGFYMISASVMKGLKALTQCSERFSYDCESPVLRVLRE